MTADRHERDKGSLATRDEMSYPDWERRLQRAEMEWRQARGVSLDAYLNRRRAGRRRADGR
jgi:hypothetical protein